jgi:putative DNA primase/helicase
MIDYDPFKHLPVIPLGHSGTKTFFYFVRSTRQVVALKPGSHSQQTFLSMAESVDWENYYRTGSSGVIDWSDIGGSLMAHCRSVGIYDPSLTRGRGAWRDGKDIVFHAGSTLFVNGITTPLEKYTDTKFRYVATPSILRPAENAAITQDSNDLLSALQTFGWEHSELSPLLILGWIGCSLICGAIQWRPHLWITGPKGCGKSTLDGLIFGILGDLVLHIQGNTTEPGLRQALNGDSRPVLFDEFEADNTNANAVIDTARAAASDNEAPVIKGTPEGNPIYYRLRFSAMFSGIIANARNEADRSRIVILEMFHRQRDEDQRMALIEKRERFGSDFGAGLLRRMLDALTNGTFDASLSTLRTAIRLAGGDERKADVFSHLLAANHVLTSDVKMTTEEASALTILITKLDEGEPSDEEACLSHLLGYLVTIEGGYKRTIGEWLIYTHEENRTGPTIEAVRAELDRHGVKPEGSGIKIANATQGIKSVYARSQWSDGSHWRILRRLPGAGAGGNARFAGSQSKCTVTPWKLIYPEDRS